MTIRTYQYTMNDDGELTHGGWMLDNPELYRFFLTQLECNDKDDRHQFPYVVICKGERNLITCSSAPYVISSLQYQFSKSTPELPTTVTLICQGNYQIELDPSTLTTNAAHVLFARVRNKQFPARFSRSAYYDLARFIVETPSGYCLRLATGDFEIIQHAGQSLLNSKS